LTQDDAPWLVRARAGDADAFAAIVDRYERRIYTFAYHMTGDAAVAAELTRETFLAAYRGLHRADADESLSVWLHRLAAEACQAPPPARWVRRLLWWKDRRAASPLPPHDFPAGVQPHSEGASAGQRALGAMSPRHRQALVLCECSGLAYGEIAAVVGVPESEVAALLLRSREEFRGLQAPPGGQHRRKHGESGVAAVADTAAGIDRAVRPGRTGVQRDEAGG
jgi:RNA polymerase sigma-70 factor, ECF subfamily